MTPAHRGSGARGKEPGADPVRAPDPPATPRHVALSWARRLQRVFGIELERCARCGGRLRIIVRIEEPEVSARMLAQLEQTAAQRRQAELPVGARALPSQPRLM